ncbi:MAG: Fe2+-dependent dioxygenase [Pseudomonadota bacterium]
MSALILAEVLSAQQLTDIRSRAAELAWAPGTRTAGRQARAVKRNAQADLESRAGKKLHADLLAAIEAHSVFQAAARPKRISRVLLSRTGEGGGYGAHTDNALMSPGGGRMRSDLSFTLFLSDPETYEGGELVLMGADGEREIKPAAGDLALYPSGDIHRVAEVTAGERLACVGWVESLVRRADQRAVLFDLATLQARLSEESDPEARLLLEKTASNLLRMWAEV